MRTYKELLQGAKIILNQHGIADADVDAWYLLAHVFGINRAEFILNKESSVTEDDRKRYMDLVEKRAKHIPLQYIIGTQEFMGIEFDVSKDVLVPRQDTENLVEAVLAVCNHKTVLDMCTGSGCIIISLAKYSKLKRAVGVDISKPALELATNNAMKHMVNIEFIQSDLFDNIEGEFDVIVSNPPYIPTDRIATLMQEVKDHEPLLALDGSLDGLLFYRRIIAALKLYLKKDGFIFFEIGFDQGQKVVEILQREGFYDIIIKKDLSGLDRIVSGKRA